MALISLYLEGEEPMGLGLGTWKPDTSRPVPGHGQDPAPPPRTRGGEHPAAPGEMPGVWRGSGAVRHSLVHQVWGNLGPVLGDILVVFEEGLHLLLDVTLQGRRAVSAGQHRQHLAPQPRVQTQPSVPILQRGVCGARTPRQAAQLTLITPNTSLRSNISWKYFRLLSAACQGMYSLSWLRNCVVFKASVTSTYLALQQGQGSVKIPSPAPPSSAARASHPCPAVPLTWPG